MPRLIGQFSRFTLVGILGTAVHYGVMATAIHALQMGPLPATCAGFICSAVLSYLLNYRITFSSVATHWVALPRFLAVGTVGLGLNALLVGLLTGPASWHWIPAQLCASALVLCWNFAANRIWTFA